MVEVPYQNFKEIFKKCKRKNVDDLKNVIQLNKESEFYREGKIADYTFKCTSKRLFGLKDQDDWEAFTIKELPGLIVLKNPFSSIGQRYWTVRCLRDYPKKPNHRNIDIEPKLKNVDDVLNYSLGPGVNAVDKLRWITLGIHHNWDTKVYNDDMRSPFPSDLNLLSQYFAAAHGYPNFSSEAAIVNIYHMNSTLSGHVDESEHDLDAPIVSISFGQSAVFIMGGRKLDVRGIPILLESGDVVLMSQEARLCYHAVPCILPTLKTPWKDASNKDGEFSIESDEFDKNLMESVRDPHFWKPFEDRLDKVRININVRQVFPHNKM